MEQFNKKEFDQLNTWFGENVDNLNQKKRGPSFSSHQLENKESELVPWFKRARLSNVDFNKLDKWFNLMRIWIKSRISSWKPEFCTNKFTTAELMKTGIYKNINRVPKIQKVVLNMGLGKALSNKKIIDIAGKNLDLIAGQKSYVTTTRKSVAQFGIRRKGAPIGCAVTLRRDRMYDYHARFILINLPRLRDFFGFKIVNFDSRGNLNFGIDDCTNFLECNLLASEQNQVGRLGFNYTVVTSAQNDLEAMLLLGMHGFPFG